MGVVYRAHDSELRRTVALKLLRPGAGSERYLVEARAASAIAHPGIVTIYEVGECDAGRFLVFEHVEGEPLSKHIPEKGLPAETAVLYAIQMADALAAAHKAGVLHRDLKPANIMVTPAGRVKILDFGLAKRLGGAMAEGDATATMAVTGPGTVIGTVQYMS